MKKYFLFGIIILCLAFLWWFAMFRLGSVKSFFAYKSYKFQYERECEEQFGSNWDQRSRYHGGYKVHSYGCDAFLMITSQDGFIFEFKPLDKFNPDQTLSILIKQYVIEDGIMYGIYESEGQYSYIRVDIWDESWEEFTSIDQIDESERYFYEMELGPDCEAKFLGYGYDVLEECFISNDFKEVQL